MLLEPRPQSSTRVGPRGSCALFLRRAPRPINPIHSKMFDFDTHVTVVSKISQELAEAETDPAKKDPVAHIGAALQKSRFLNNPVTAANIIAQSPVRTAIDTVDGKDATGVIPRERAIVSAEKALGLIAFWAILGPVTEKLQMLKYGNTEI